MVINKARNSYMVSREERWQGNGGEVGFIGYRKGLHIFISILTLGFSIKVY